MQQDTFHGRLQQHHNTKFSKGWCKEEAFSLRNLRFPTEVACERTPSKISTFKILGPDMILLNSYWGVGSKSYEGFYEPYFRKGRIHMWFGREYDHKIPPVPQQLVSLAATAVQDAQPHLTKLPSVTPATCLVCFYPSSCGRIGLHQIPDDSGRGSPVVSIFIGEAAEFVYRQSGATKLKSVLLKSGDVLIYGGKSRSIYHGVTQIRQPIPLPLFLETGLKSGCLNLNLM
ncbi:DNA N(6)-methyladenine demethylase ALKBH1C-like [Bidens hawaiensis]|uniref:DNA N(6)-methyladenine demethylase ALKBH1C-like n=1 Tax=Bidens hawaiensis TaxID=980011 RepID=UPI00404A71AA